MLVLSGPGPERRMINSWEAGGMVVARRFCLVGARDCVYKGFMEEVSSGWASKAE